jgi:hypothetical protein
MTEEQKNTSEEKLAEETVELTDEQLEPVTGGSIRKSTLKRRLRKRR